MVYKKKKKRKKKLLKLDLEQALDAVAKCDFKLKRHWHFGTHRLTQAAKMRATEQGEEEPDVGSYREVDADVKRRREAAHQKQKQQQRHPKEITKI